jgi:hypothetical protein
MDNISRFILQLVFGRINHRDNGAKINPEKQGASTIRGGSLSSGFDAGNLQGGGSFKFGLDRIADGYSTRGDVPRISYEKH